MFVQIVKCLDVGTFLEWDAIEARDQARGF